jgi:DNA-binding NtrC family response regulator
MTVSGTGKARIPRVLFVSPNEQDHASIENLNRAQWVLYHAKSLGAALDVLKKHDIASVLCERDLPPDTWIDLLERMNAKRPGPPLIVTSRFADERLWVEALSLGAYDVLAEPLDRTELVRSVELASSHWYQRQEIPARFVRVMRAAG